MYDYLSNLLFYNLILRLFLEGYLEYATTSFLNITNVSIHQLNILQLNWVAYTGKLSSVFAIIIAVIIVSLPFITWILLWRRVGTLSDHENINTFGALYAELRKDSRIALLYHVIYMIRRLVFALNAVLLQNYPWA